mgnify:CR=1 FL=1
MNKATATVHFSLCERVSHNYTSRDYLIARLPFVLQTPGDYPQSFEVHVNGADLARGLTAFRMKQPSRF